MGKIHLHRLRLKEDKIILGIKAPRTKKKIILVYELDKTFEEFSFDILKNHYSFTNLNKVWKDYEIKLQRLFNKNITKEKAFKNRFFIELCEMQKQLVKKGPKCK